MKPKKVAITSFSNVYHENAETYGGNQEPIVRSLFACRSSFQIKDTDENGLLNYWTTAEDLGHESNILGPQFALLHL